MKNEDLHYKFIEALKLKIPSKNKLVSVITDTLNIERESAYRRLNGRVLFTVQEVGILAVKLNISLDSLLYSDKAFTSMPFKIHKPLQARSLNDLADLMLESHLSVISRMCENEAEMGVVFDSLPIELCIPHTNLCRFMYFKWGHYFVGTNEFAKFKNWLLPPRIVQHNSELIEKYKKYKRIFYIWDIPVIWNLAKDIKYFHSIYVLDHEDVGLIKKDLHEMLFRIEEIAKGVRKEPLDEGNIYFYISNVNIGTYYSYHLSEDDFCCFFKSYFIQSIVSDDYSIFTNLKNLINSMKTVSTLISGSGEKERRLFFEEQHRIIDLILK